MRCAVKSGLSKDYFSEAFVQAVRYPKLWRKVEKVLGALLVFAGVAIML